MGTPWSNLITSTGGIGPLIQRDYWATIRECKLRPSQIIEWVARSFAEFSPVDRAVFRLISEKRTDPVLQTGDTLEVKIPIAGCFQVCVLHKDAFSFTLGTISGHPEAGRITFGAYRDQDGGVIFHIRSRARSSARRFLLGFKIVGDPMQIHTWTDFVNNVAINAGSGVEGVIHAETTRLSNDFQDDPMSPTYIAKCDEGD